MLREKLSDLYVQNLSNETIKFMKLLLNEDLSSDQMMAETFTAINLFITFIINRFSKNDLNFEIKFLNTFISSLEIYKLDLQRKQNNV